MSHPVEQPVEQPVEHPVPEWPDRPAPRPLIGRHPVDAASLVPGLLAVAVALVALLELDVDLGVLLPVLLVLAGVAGLAAAVQRSRS